MLWTPEKTYREDPFEQESELEDAILQVATLLFGDTRIYLDAKRKIGARGRTRNIPDGYLIDLSSNREPKLYVVENELAKHEPLRHIAIQILEFSLSFEASPQAVKGIVRESLRANPDGLSKCQAYALQHGFENVDYLLERMVFGPNRFNALVVIDELDEELETVLISRFKFPVEILTLERYAGPGGERLLRFDPFLADIAAEPVLTTSAQPIAGLDPSDIDTIVVPARDEGFNDVFLGENRWYKIRIHSSMIPKVKNIAVYRVAPESAITHIAPVSSIEQWQDTNKYVVNFAEPARKIGPIPLVVPNGRVRALQAPRYTSRALLEKASNLDEAFNA
jgi:hypothetical protein